VYLKGDPALELKFFAAPVSRFNRTVLLNCMIEALVRPKTSLFCTQNPEL
jgi:hypothetical protein